MKVEQEVCKGGNEGQRMEMKVKETKKVGNMESNEGRKKMP